MIGTVLTIVGVAIVTSACGRGDAPAAATNGGGSQVTGAPADAGSFTLARSACRFEGPASLATGTAEFGLASSGGTADFDLWLLRDGHTYAELAAHIDEERRRSEQGSPPLGHPTFASLVAEASTDSAGHGVMRTQLTAGVYGMACIRFDGPGRLEGLWAAGPVTVDG